MNIICKSVVFFILTFSAIVLAGVFDSILEEDNEQQKLAVDKLPTPTLAAPLYPDGFSKEEIDQIATQYAPRNNKNQSFDDAKDSAFDNLFSVTGTTESDIIVFIDKLVAFKGFTKNDISAIENTATSISSNQLSQQLTLASDQINQDNEIKSHHFQKIFYSDVRPNKNLPLFVWNARYCAMVSARDLNKCATCYNEGAIYYDVSLEIDIHSNNKGIKKSLDKIKLVSNEIQEGKNCGLISTRNTVPPSFKNTKDKILNDIHLLTQALELYKLDNFSYPSQQAGLSALIEIPPEANNWSKEGYFNSQRIPDDPWGNPYIYRVPGQYGNFDLFTYGADATLGGTGDDEDIGNWDL